MHGRYFISVQAAALCALLVTALLAMPAAADETSSSADVAFASARESARSGDYDVAMQQYAELLLIEPENVDYLFGYAQVLLWSGDAERSLQFLERALELAPDYEELRRFEAQAREAAAEPAPRDFLWAFDAGRDALSNSTDWQQFGVRIGRAFPAVTVNLSATRYERFDTTDTQVGIDGTVDIGDHWLAYAAYSTSSSTGFTPGSAGQVALSRRFERGWVGGLRAGRRDYGATTVDSFALLVEKYFSRYRIACVTEDARISSEHALSNAVTFNVYSGSGHMFGAVAAHGEEIEVVAPGQLLRTSVTSFALLGRHPVSDYLDIGWRLGTHEQGDFYRRNFFGLTLSGGF
ncbi:MAG: YaiO family outer membrane beta-barrel protein [Woeseiaceae bacterium]|nr:YaiO family outer membrane beta-barrel protein [Woeseiaceae bacterium]